MKARRHHELGCWAEKGRYFCRAFRVFTGLPPREFMRQYQEHMVWRRQEVERLFHPDAAPLEWLPVPIWNELLIALEVRRTSGTWRGADWNGVETRRKDCRQR